MTIRVSWPILGLAAVFAAAVVAAVLELGPPSSSARTARELVTAQTGVVQSTVTGTGNIEPSTDVEADFQTSGVLQNIYVHDGDHVVKGQLLATLNPTSAQLTVDQAQEQLTSAEDQLTNAQNEKTSSSSTAASDRAPVTTTTFVSYRPTQTSTQTGTTPTGTTPTATTAPTRTGTTPARTSAPAATTPSTTRGSGSSGGSGGSGGSGSSGGSGGSGSNASSGSSSTGTVSAATKAGDIASAQASVDGAQASLTTAENTLHETHLYAPATGTVVSVASISPGDTVSGGSSSGSGNGSGSSSGSSGSSASSSSGSSGTGTAAGGLGGASGSSGASSSSSSSSGFIEIVNTRAMTVSVPFSESDIGQLKVGQTANVTLEALAGVELAGHVSAISTLGTSSSGVVSYDATITVDQHDSKVKPGMSASVSVVTGQATGVNLPSSAVTGTAGSVSHVNVVQNGHTVSTPVVVGLVGTSRTQIVSGLRAGQQVVVTETLPALGTSSSSGTGSTGALGRSGLGGVGLGGGGLGGGGLRRLGGGGGFPGGG